MTVDFDRTNTGRNSQTLLKKGSDTGCTDGREPNTGRPVPYRKGPAADGDSPDPNPDAIVSPRALRRKTTRNRGLTRFRYSRISARVARTSGTVARGSDVQYGASPSKQVVPERSAVRLTLRRPWEASR